MELSEKEMNTLFKALETWTNDYYKVNSRAYNEKIELLNKLKDKCQITYYPSGI